MAFETDPLIESLAATFAAELAERMPALKTLLAQLQQAWVAADVRALARSLHNLKGAARVAGATGIEQLAHAAEGAVLRATARPTAASPDWFEALYALVDGMAALHAGAPIDMPGLLSRVEALGMDAAPEAAPTPAASSVAPAPLPAAQPAVAPAAAEHPGTVRVAVKKLDALLTESGELSVIHLRVSQRARELRQMQRDLERWQREWTKHRPLRMRIARANNRSEVGPRDVEALLRLAERTDRLLQELTQRTSQLDAALAHNASQFGAVAAAVGQEVLAIRLMPTATIFLPMERLVRDLSRDTGKETRLVLSGTDTEVDRRILDELRDPLMHMVRNSIDHGIESPQERMASGKPAYGTVHLSAAQRGDRVQICIEDDGRGLDVDAIRAAAVNRGVLSAERAASLETAAVFELIFHPGFTTRSSVSTLSGRGVGLDVVREHVQRLGGAVATNSTPGAGTRFVITVPLTLATTRVLLVEDGGQTMAIPTSAIQRTGRAPVADLLTIEGRRVLQLDGRAIPVVDLATVLGRTGNPERDASAEAVRSFLVLTHGERSVALLTDRLVDEHELVVKGLEAPLRRVKHVAGAAVLATGDVAVVLNPTDLARTALASLDSGALAGWSTVTPAARSHEMPRRRILVVDDSVMTRTLERSILQAAGYEALVASDGVQALEVLGTQAVDAIISDVEMPRMTGLELTSAVRQDERFRHLPVVLVTSLDKPEHIERGASAGADAYIVKGQFDQAELLGTLGRLL